jgi:pimeloyl-ACP methyl ester carboxylesterase
MRIAWTPVAVLALLACAEASASRALGTLNFEPCTLSSPSSPVAHEAQCTRLKVPENHAEPTGRNIELFIAWVPASGEAEPDPVFFLAGGPGQAATEGWPQLAGAFQDLSQNRHLILVDQRGTGKSNPLHCESADDPDDLNVQGEALRELAAQQATQCLAKLSDRADPRFYTTSDAVRDLETVRVAIGAERINVVGVSYGTRVAQQYAKTYPAATRSVVLDSPITTSLVLGSEHARNIDDALKAQIARCAANSGCQEKMGDLQTQLDAVRAQLRGGELSAVRFRDSVSGEWLSEVPQIGHLGLLLRMYSYQSITAAILPLVIHQASAGDWELLLAQANSMGRSLSAQLAHGMELSVLCAEDADELTANPADRDTLLGGEFVDYLKAQCEVWPKGARPADFRAPLTGSVPTLILSGEFDPVTPPRYAAEIAGHLPESLHLNMTGQGHTQLAVGCMPKLFAQFIERASVKALETDCLKRVKPMPPFSGLYGWDP